MRRFVQYKGACPPRAGNPLNWMVPVVEARTVKLQKAPGGVGAVRLRLRATSARKG